MNVELYNESLLTLNRVIGTLNSEVVEDHVCDAASYHDEMTGFYDDWSGDVPEVYEALCEYFHIKELEVA